MTAAPSPREECEACRGHQDKRHPGSVFRGCAERFKAASDGCTEEWVEEHHALLASVERERDTARAERDGWRQRSERFEADPLYKTAPAMRNLLDLAKNAQVGGNDAWGYEVRKVLATLPKEGP
jgi:predicted Zn-dependent protease